MSVPNKCDGALADLLLSKFDTEMEMTKNVISHQLDGRNFRYYSITYGNEIANIQLQQMRHKYHLLQRQYILKSLELNTKMEPSKKKEIIQTLDCLNGLIYYDYQMAKKAVNNLKIITENNL